MGDTRFIVLKYSFGDDHVVETLRNGQIGIPAFKSGTRSGPSGKLGFQKTTEDNPLYYILYDVKTQKVRGIGSSLGRPFYTDVVGDFQPDAEVPNENWGHRLHGMTMLNDSRAISRIDFLNMGGKLGQGAAAYVNEDVWNATKERLIRRG